MIRHFINCLISFFLTILFICLLSLFDYGISVVVFWFLCCLMVSMLFAYLFYWIIEGDTMDEFLMHFINGISLR